MNGKISLPNLPTDQIAEIKALHESGLSLKEICDRLNCRYTLVYFYAVNGGRRAGLEIPESCWCGRPHYAKGLCSRHYQQALYARRREERGA